MHWFGNCGKGGCKECTNAENVKDGFDWNNKVYYDPSQYPKHLSISKRIEPRKGRTVMFDGKFLHAGMHPRNADYRIVINFNIEKA